MRRSLAVLGVVAFVALSVGFTAPAASSADEPLRMTVGTLGRIGSLDVRTGTSRIAREVWNLQYPTLTSLDAETGAPTPGVASGWRPSPNGRGWIYTLRNLNWSDGKPVTADDVMYSFTHGQSERWPFEGEFLDGLGIRKVNDHAVEIISHENTQQDPGLLLHIVPAHVYSKLGGTLIDTDVAALGVGDGAWHVVAKSDDSVQLDVLGRPAGPPLDQIVFRTYPSADALVDALAQGDVDVISGVPYSYLDRLDSIDGVTVNHAPHGKRYVVRLNSPTGEDLRTVVSLAVDREALIAEAVNGIATPAPVAARPDEARKALKQLDPDGNLQVTIAANVGSVNRRAATFVRDSLRAVGLKTEFAGAGADGDMAVALNTDRDDKRLTIPLFDVDSLQAFRTDNVAGFLREPAQRSLVVFGPTAAQYGAIVAAHAPPGEQLSDLTYAFAGGLLVLLCGLGYVIASRVRRRTVT